MAETERGPCGEMTDVSPGGLAMTAGPCDREPGHPGGHSRNWQVNRPGLPIPLPRMEAIVIPEGSLVVLRDVDLDIDARESLLRILIQIVGHHRFLILHIYDESDVEVVGPGNVATFLQSLNLTSPNEGDSPDGTEERDP